MIAFAAVLSLIAVAILLAFALFFLAVLWADWLLRLGLAHARAAGPALAARAVRLFPPTVRTDHQDGTRGEGR